MLIQKEIGWFLQLNDFAIVFRKVKMAKRLVVLIASLMVVVFIAGCPAIEPEPIADFRLTIDDLKSKIENQKSEIESVETEPDDVELASVEPNEPEQPQVEPDEIAPAEPEPNEVGPSIVGPNNVEPAWVEPNDLKLRPAVSFHDKCAELLKNNVDDKGMVDYKTLRRKRLQLKALLQ